MSDRFSCSRAWLWGAIATPVFGMLIFLASPIVPIARAQSIYTATTSVIISVCGNGIVEPPLEVCDDGRNTGTYSTSTAGRSCAPGCGSWGPYCGDGILQSQFGEQCDTAADNGVTGSGCSATCQIESVAPLPGPAPAGSSGGGPYTPGSNNPPTETQVIVRGEAYPGANVNILEDGATIGVVQADSSANFYFSTTNVSPGVATFGFWAQDANGLKSIALTTTFTVTAGAVTTVSGVNLPPTITVNSRQINQGDTLVVSGESAPLVTIDTYVHSSGDIVISTTTDANGNWSVPVDTANLQNNALHTVEADFTTTGSTGGTERSTLSQTVSFFVGAGGAGKKYLADLNGDSKVNLEDFSILLYYWGTSSPIADLNSDGAVNLDDFSILLYYWTG